MSRKLNDYRSNFHAAFKDDPHIAVVTLDTTSIYQSKESALALTIVCDDLDMQQCYDHVKVRIPHTLCIIKMSYFCIGKHVFLVDVILQELTGQDICIERGCHQWIMKDGGVVCEYCGERALKSEQSEGGAS